MALDPIRLLRDPVLRFASAVIVAGAVALGVAAASGAFAPLAHPPVLLVVFLLLSAASESLMIRVPGQDDELRISASSLMSFSTLVLYGTGAGIAAFALTLALIDAFVRRPAPVKVAFNVAQCTLAIGAAGLVLDLVGHGPLGWSAAAATQLVVNNLCTSRVTSLALGVPFVAQLRSSAAAVVADGLLLAYSPIVCLVAREGAWLLPVVALPFAALFWSGREADRRRSDALHDGLTSLPNRVLFGQRLRHELRRASRSVDVMLLDLDGFKEVNDALGHAYGDDVLREVARRLSRCAGEDGIVARLGGDEFGVVLVGIEDVVAVARRMRVALEEPLALGELRLRVSASTGIARWPVHGEDADELLRHADVAMYLAKGARTGCELYDPARDPYGPERLALLGELREGIPRGELVVHYQPKLSLRSGLVEGAEALVRWQHPRRGLLGPGEFVELAEQSDLMPALTASVLESALAQVAAWRALGMTMSVAVNVPPEALHDQALPAAVSAALARHGVGGSALHLEITESSLMRDAARATEILDALRALGVRVAIDDFGTGYSSLAWLKRLPVHEIKIDRSFVLEMDERSSDAAIVQSTVQLGQTLGLAVVAEGVETASALERLRSFGCDVAQGYLISRPLPADELTAWLLERGREPLAA